jgi:heme A synthase
VKLTRLAPAWLWILLVAFALLAIKGMVGASRIFISSPVLTVAYTILYAAAVVAFIATLIAYILRGDKDPDGNS